MSISQLICSEDQKELGKVVHLQPVKVLTLSTESWSRVETNRSHIGSAALAVEFPDCLHQPFQALFNRQFSQEEAVPFRLIPTNRVLSLPELQAVKWLFLTNSSKPVILVWIGDPSVCFLLIP